MGDELGGDVPGADAVGLEGVCTRRALGRWACLRHRDSLVRRGNEPQEKSWNRVSEVHGGCQQRKDSDEETAVEHSARREAHRTDEKAQLVPLQHAGTVDSFILLQSLE